MYPHHWLVPEATRRALLETAKKNRRNPTRSERLLWEAVRRKTLGVRSRRQQPIGPYIVDFYIPKVKLVVEIDGASHQGREYEDANRERNLTSLGYKFFRVAARDVESDIDGVFERLRKRVMTGVASISPC